MLCSSLCFLSLSTSFSLSRACLNEIINVNQLALWGIYITYILDVRSSTEIGVPLKKWAGRKREGIQFVNILRYCLTLFVPRFSFLLFFLVGEKWKHPVCLVLHSHAARLKGKVWLPRRTGQKNWTKSIVPNAVHICRRSSHESNMSVTWNVFNFTHAHTDRSAWQSGNGSARSR